MRKRRLAVVATIFVLVVAIFVMTSGRVRQPSAGNAGDSRPQSDAWSVSAGESRPGARQNPRPVEAGMDAEVGGTTDWSATYYQREDAFSFIRQAAERALTGDGEAAYFIAQAIGRCYGREKDAWNAPDPEVAFAAKWAKYPSEHFAIENDRNAMEDCLRYVREDAFASLPDDGSLYRDPAFWQDLAYRANNPKALVRHTLLALAGLPDAPSERGSSVVQAAEADIQKVLASGDLAAMFGLGQVFGSLANRSAGFQGLEIQLAACELGFNCTMDNPALREYLGCFGSGTCSEITEFQDIVRQGLPPDVYAATYSRAQELAEAVRRGDTAALEEHPRIQLRRSNTTRGR